MILTKDQIYLLLDRLKWVPVYEDDQIVLAKKQRIGYSDDPKIASIQAALSIMLEVAVKKR